MSAFLVVLLLFLIFFGIPITFALGVVGLVFFIANGLPLDTFAQRLAVGVDSFPLLAAPFFILSGNLMNTGGITKRIFNFANSIVGHFPGGLGHVNVLGSMIFAGMSGSALADAAGLGQIEIQAMVDAKYDIEFSAAVTTASAVIGPIIPPSTIMVIYGVTGGVPIDRLFLGGFIPGVLLGLSMMGLVYYYAKKRSYPRNDRFRLKALWENFQHAFLALLTPLIIIGGILSGVCTPTEAGALAAAYALILSLFIYREISVSDLPKILLETMLVSGVILFIVSTASIFGWVLAFEQAPQKLAQYLVGLSTNKYVILSICNVAYLILGCLMEASSIVIMTVPIMIPLLVALNIDLVHFGVLLAILMSIGTTTPPVGTVMFVICKFTGLSIERYARTMLPWFALMIGVTFFLTFFPQITLFLPNLLGK